MSYQAEDWVYRLGSRLMLGFGQDGLDENPTEENEFDIRVYDDVTSLTEITSPMKQQILLSRLLKSQRTCFENVERIEMSSSGGRADLFH